LIRFKALIVGLCLWFIYIMYLAVKTEDKK